MELSVFWLLWLFIDETDQGPRLLRLFSCAAVTILVLSQRY